MTYQEYVEAYNKLIEELQSIIKDTPPGLKSNPNDPVARDLMARHKKLSEDMVNLTSNYFSEQEEE